MYRHPDTLATPKEETLVKSGYYYPNRFARVVIEVLAEVMGQNGLNAVQHYAGLNDYIDNPPPYDLRKGFDFADFTALNIALEDMYGARGVRGLGTHTGRVLYAYGLRGLGALAGIEALEFQVLPLSARLRIGLPTLANVFNQFSDQASRVFEVDDERIVFAVERCPMCWQRRTNHRACHITKGLLQEALTWISDGHEFEVEIETCMAQGRDMGQYTIYKEPLE